ncbi:imidazole glycerol phosphate synthase subunit HisH [Pseudomonas sp. S25]|uniref:Imidazole glycerol phosphate synthase subunit HisH n=1 Tax=Pseudomonas maioricensis TaxID=1766623 RepID=A0ABS9ZJI6_9PSED|nr:imidazole glycerol phosphate synthase subunit HisH [Pseudomonas sp. S25]MCI8210382.1 imidazole glycerol phosphate synthase subunit HisH [Pseudomonas sp. S25]
MSNVISLVDYGVGNLLSVRRALEHCGAQVELVTTPEQLACAGKVLLPGVGAYANAMAILSEHGLADGLRDFSRTGNPLLGICLGMQLLLDSSTEFGFVEGLGLIPGSVLPIPRKGVSGESVKVPNIGWRDLQPASGRDGWNDTLLHGTQRENNAVYFVHSFMAVPDSDEHRVADCMYGGAPVAAVIENGNVWGAQFHPEKSGKVGLSMLQTFVNLR